MTDEQLEAAHTVIAAHAANNRGTLQKWLTNSGAARHMCNDASLFVSKKPLSMRYTDGHVVTVLWEGTIDSPATSGDIELNTVLYVPGLLKDLLSVSALLCMGRGVVAAYTGHVSITQNGAPFMAVHMSDSLFWLNTYEKIPTVTLNGPHTLSATDWHHRLAHMSCSNIIAMHKANMLTVAD